MISLITIEIIAILVKPTHCVTAYFPNVIILTCSSQKFILTYKPYQHNTHFLLPNLKFISDTSSCLSDTFTFLGWTLYHHFAFMYGLFQPAHRKPFLSICLVYLISHGIVEKNDQWKGCILLSTFIHRLLKSYVNDLTFTFQLFLDTIMQKKFIRKNISWSFR